MNYTQLVAKVKTEGGFDVADDVIGGWVNEVYKEAVAASEWMEATVELGPTVAGTADYDIPDNAVGVNSLRVDGSSSFLRVSTSDLWALQSTDASIFPTSRSVFAPNYSASGQRQITIYPTPDESGLSISALIVQSPSDLSGTQVPIVPEDMHGRLVDGAVAIGYQRIDERPDLGAGFDQKLAEIVSALRQRARSQVPGEGSRLQIEFVDF